jgi:type I restriction enzyme, S subunit
MNWSPYPEYKNSGIEWLGDIPTSWEVAEVKLTHQVTLGKMLRTEASNSSDVLLPYLRAAHIPPTGFTLNDPKEMWFTPKEKSELTLRKGDVVVVEGGMGGYGRCDIVPEDVPGWGFQNSINRLRPKNGNNGAFTKYLLQIARENGYIDVLCSVSTMPHLTAEKLGAIRLPLPTVDEQSKIGEFLDFEVAKIDALIGKQEHLIATLREDRHAQLINLVAHGCDSATALKPCNLGWVEAVPNRWDVVNIRRVALMKTGHTPSRTVVDYWENTTIPWFTLADVWQLRDGLTTYLGETKDRISEMGLANSAAELLPAGTVVLSRTASVGFTGIMPAPMATSQDFWNWVCGPQLLPEYLMYTFRAMQGYFSALMMGSTHQTIYQADAAAIRIPLPPLSEQQQIVRQVVFQNGCH